MAHIKWKQEGFIESLLLTEITIDSFDWIIAVRDYTNAFEVLAIAEMLAILAFEVTFISITVIIAANESSSVRRDRTLIEIMLVSEMSANSIVDFKVAVVVVAIIFIIIEDILRCMIIAIVTD